MHIGGSSPSGLKREGEEDEDVNIAQVINRVNFGVSHHEEILDEF